MEYIEQIDELEFSEDTIAELKANILKVIEEDSGGNNSCFRDEEYIICSDCHGEGGGEMDGCDRWGEHTTHYSSCNQCDGEGFTNIDIASLSWVNYSLRQNQLFEKVIPQGYLDLDKVMNNFKAFWNRSDEYGLKYWSKALSFDTLVRTDRFQDGSKAFIRHLDDITVRWVVTKSLAYLQVRSSFGIIKESDLGKLEETMRDLRHEFTSEASSRGYIGGEYESVVEL
jgi:DnaJ-class molecular chaperone